MYKLLIGVLTLAAVSYGDYSFMVTDLPDLSHDAVYTYGCNYNLAEGEIITQATLTITNVSNWVNTENNALFIDLIDDAAPGFTSIASESNNDNSLTDYFTANGRSADQLDRLNWNISPTDAGLYSLRNPGPGNIMTNYSADRILIPSSTYYTGSDGNVYAVNEVVINFTASELASLTNFLAGNDNNFGFGLDPDCHFEVSKFAFNMKTTTANVPEPTLISLLGCGLLGLVLVRRRK